MSKAGKRKFGLLPRIIVAIAAGIGVGLLLPLLESSTDTALDAVVRLFATFNSIFSNFLQFLVPLIIIGLVTPAIGDIGKSAGKLLLVTAAIAYLDTICAGFISFGTSSALFPHLIPSADTVSLAESVPAPQPFFTVEIPAMLSVMSALVFAFTLGLGMAFFGSPNLKTLCSEFKSIVVRAIEVVIIPLLPLYIFGIFLSMAYTGEALHVVQTFLAIIGVIFGMHIILLVLQYCLAGLLTRRNPFRLLAEMLPAYFTALGTSSSAATIPVTLEQTVKNGVNEGIAGFVVPLCATIHLSGSTLKIVACAVALMLMYGLPFDFGMIAGFVMMLGVMMVAAPGVPGGAIMAALGILGSMLGFDSDLQALMIALYITMDSFGTACNVTGDGAIALIVDRFWGPGRQKA